MEFRLLGPLEVAVDGEPVRLGGIRQQTVLAMLLLDTQRTVTVGRLVEATYGDGPPATARVQVQICISALRRLFARYGHTGMIATRAQGYLLQVPPTCIDLGRFDALVQNARRARAQGAVSEAAASYRAALALWRGPVLEGIESRPIRLVADRLEEVRITCLEDCIQLELALGRHHELIGELSHLVETHPLRERLREELMTALYRSGRDAEALHVYRSARHTMIEELGIEPSKRLQQLERAILIGDDALDPPQQPDAATAEPARPRTGACRMLPMDIADFTGRTEQIEKICAQLLGSSAARPASAVPIVAVCGKAGVGKTALAIHAAHRVAESFPDGQLFADLHGTATQPLPPMQILERFLRVLGVIGTALPEGLEERAELFRTLVADRQMLIVLDNAHSESQVLPLLPGTPASVVLMTSRSRLAGLPGTMHVDLDVYDLEQCTELLRRIVGTGRIDREPEAARELADLCGRLPLALRIAGARLSARRHWRVRQLVDRLRNDARRLDELSHGDMGIRAGIEMSYTSATPMARRLLRRLAMLECETFSCWASAALLDCSIAEARDHLDSLADAQLIDAGAGATHEYRLSTLIRLFAQERLFAEESDAERTAALRRVLGSLLFLADAARQRVYGENYRQPRSDAQRRPLPPDLVDRLIEVPLQWFEQERSALVSGVRQAAQAQLTEVSWDLALAGVTLFESRYYLDDWRETHQIALAAARRDGDRRGQAAILYSLGSLYIAENRFDVARRDLEAALKLFEEIGDRTGQALVARNLGLLDRLVGCFDDAAAHYQDALATFRELRDQVSAAYVLHGLAEVRLQHADSTEAMRLLTEALELSRAGGSRRVEAQVLHRMGHTYLQDGSPRAAADAFVEALTAVRELDDVPGQAHALRGLGTAQLRLRQLGQAERTLRHATELAHATGQRLVEALTMVAQAEMALILDQPGRAVDLLHRAQELMRGLGVPMHEVRTSMMLSEAYDAQGDAAAAHAVLTEAVPLTDRIDETLAQRVRTELGDRLHQLYSPR